LPAISSGVAVEPATYSRKIGFRQTHQEQMGQAKNRKVCELGEQALELEDIGPGNGTRDGQLVEVTDPAVAHP
jgi:non-homologous end joining protein Ku